MLYGLSAWYYPATGALPAWEMARVVNEFTRIQRRATILISGAFKSTSAAAANVELFIRPNYLQMQQNIEAAILIQIGVHWAQPACLYYQREPKQRRLGGWSPLEAL